MDEDLYVCEDVGGGSRRADDMGAYGGPGGSDGRGPMSGWISVGSAGWVVERGDDWMG